MNVVGDQVQALRYPGGRQILHVDVAAHASPVAASSGARPGTDP